MGEKDVFEEVCTFMYLGYAPSFIDKVLGLRPGTAHDMVVDSWASTHGFLPKGCNPGIIAKYPKLYRDRKYYKVG